MFLHKHLLFSFRIYNFESLYAVDIELFNRHMKMLLNGERVEIPTFNFKTGKKEYNGIIN